MFEVRSVLFLPASNPRAITKARDSAADLVVLDLEDAVKPADKKTARDAAADAVAADWPMPVAIRINRKWPVVNGFLQDIKTESGVGDRQSDGCQSRLAVRCPRTIACFQFPAGRTESVRTNVASLSGRSNALGSDHE